MANVSILLNCTNNTGAILSYIGLRVVFVNAGSMFYAWQSMQTLAAGASTTFNLSVEEGDRPSPIIGGSYNVFFYTDSSGYNLCATAILDPDIVFTEGDMYSISLVAADSGGGDSGGGDDSGGGGGGGGTPSGSGSKITYSLSEFDPLKAASGALCVMVAKNYSAATIASTNSSFGGAGICECKEPDTYILTISSIIYKFNREGKTLNLKGSSEELKSANYKILLGTVQQTLSEAGGAIGSGTRTVVTRSADGSYSSTTTDEDTTVLVDSLTARDNFAINALKTLMQRASKDPSTLSNNEMAFYCDVAYQWAANMMSAAAKVRATIEDESGPSVNEESLTTNTEKLLYDMSEAIIDTKHTMESLTLAVLNLDNHICNKLQALVDK